MTPLDDLIAAVEADADEVDMLPVFPELQRRNWFAAAYNGSLDAALRLHEALLPGWVYDMDNIGNIPWVAVQSKDGDMEAQGTAETLSRAWLLAILRALKAQEGRE